MNLRNFIIVFVSCAVLAVAFGYRCYPQSMLVGYPVAAVLGLNMLGKFILAFLPPSLR